MRVLLIEDDASVAANIELMLKSESFNTYTTDLGEEDIDLGKLSARAQQADIRDVTLLQTRSTSAELRYRLRQPSIYLAKNVRKTTVKLTLKSVRKGCLEFKNPREAFAVRATWKQDRSDHVVPRRTLRDHTYELARSESITARLARIDASSPSMVVRARSASSAG